VIQLCSNSSIVMIDLLNHPLYCITSDNVTSTHADQVSSMAQEGVKIIQVRSKEILVEEEVKRLSSAIKDARKLGACVIVNDDPRLCNATGADGVHLGSNDEPPKSARLAIGEGKIIGGTVHSFDEAHALKLSGYYDYAGIGPFRNSSTKQELRPKLSIKDIIQIVSFLSPVPCFLIGGLDSMDFSLLTETGARGICVCSGLNKGKNFGAYLEHYTNESQKYYG